MATIDAPAPATSTSQNISYNDPTDLMGSITMKRESASSVSIKIRKRNGTEVTLLNSRGQHEDVVFVLHRNKSDNKVHYYALYPEAKRLYTKLTTDTTSFTETLTPVIHNESKVLQTNVYVGPEHPYIGVLNDTIIDWRLNQGADNAINPSNYINTEYTLATNGTAGLTNYNFTEARKDKLEGIEANAEVNVQPNWNGVGKVNGEILNKPTNADIQNLSRQSIQFTTTGGSPGSTNLGNITYNETSGTITYSPVTDSDVINSFTAGSNINISSGEISADLSSLSSVYHPIITSSSRLNANLIGSNSSVSNNEYKQLNGLHTNETIQDQIDTLSSNISQNASDIQLKQDAITSSNRLNANLIGSNGNVSNDEYKQLNGINTNQTIQDQLNSKQASGSYQLSLESPVTASVASGTGNLTLGNGTGFNTKLTYTPPDLSSFITAVPNGTNANKIANGSVSNTEFQRLNGVTSAIQTQLNNKMNKNSVPTFVLTNSTASNAPTVGRLYLHSTISMDMNDGAPGANSANSASEIYYWAGGGDGVYLHKSGVNNTANFVALIAGWYNISCMLHCTEGTANNQSMIWGFVEKIAANGTLKYEHFLCSSYYKDDSSDYDNIVVCGDVCMYLEVGQKFRIRTDVSYSRDKNDDNPPNTSLSYFWCQYMFT